MALDKKQQRLVEAIRSTLKASVIDESVLADMLKDVQTDVPDETAHGSQFRWEGIDDAFRLKVAGTPHEEAITSAFYQTHSYKYLDHPTFKIAFERELKQRAVPTAGIQDAMEHIDTLTKELAKNPGEQDSGWHPQLDEIADMTRNADTREANNDEPTFGGGLYPEGDKYDKGDLEGF